MAQTDRQTDTHTDGHGDSMTNSVKTGKGNVGKENTTKGKIYQLQPLNS